MNGYAAEIDVAVDTLREYRDVLLRWGGQPHRVPATSWTVLREIADAKGDPFETYDAIEKAYGVVNTVNVRLYRGKGDWNHDEAKAKARKAKQLMADPAVAADVVADVLAHPETGAAVAEQVMERSTAASTNVARAAQRQQDKNERAAADRTRSRMPGLVRNGHVLDAHRLIAHARRDLEDAIAQVQAALPLASDEQVSFDEDLESTRRQLDALAEVVAAGTRSLDEQLKDLTGR